MAGKTYQMSLLTRAEGGCNPAGDDFFVMLKKGIKSYLAGARGGKIAKSLFQFLTTHKLVHSWLLTGGFMDASFVCHE